MTKGLAFTTVLFTILFFLLLSIFLLFQSQEPFVSHKIPVPSHSLPQRTPTPALPPLAIASLRSRTYPGSVLHMEQTLPDGANYHQYIVSYQSDGLTIHALLTVPLIKKPSGGFPAILFNHGYIAPSAYQTAPLSGQYAAYVDALAKEGYVVLKPDYRGNGTSEGQPAQIYISPGYVIDDLNALSSLKEYGAVNPERIGVWGHSMGGLITLYDLVITKDLKAAVIWSGVVGSFPEILSWWPNRHNIAGNDLTTRQALQQLLQQVGSPAANPSYWNSVDPSNFIQDITVPVQIHVGLADQTVPPDFSLSLAKRLKDNGKSVQLYMYPGDDHNISQNFDQAFARTIQFFNSVLKQ